MSMIADDHFHLDSLREFTTELATAGFSPVAGFEPQRWRGAIHKAFASLTEAETMDIVIRPGWPFISPAIIVDGLNTNHSTLNGYVCMWRDDDSSLEWTTLRGLFSRVEEWCDNAKHNWREDQLDQDAYLNFHNKYALAVTFDLSELGVHKGGWGEFHAAMNQSPARVDILAGPRRSANHLRGLWFHVGALSGPPPRQLFEVTAYLPRQQRKGLRKALSERRKPEPLIPSGGVDLILFCWERRTQTDLLAMVCTGKDDDVESVALQPGPRDEDSLILRAGPDAPELRGRTAVIFGAGALGGHTAALLAESGIGNLTVVDPDVLLPGNVVRHIAGHSRVGDFKVQAVQAVIADHAPWTRVAGYQEWARTPRQIRERIDGADIIIDTTGNEALTNSLAMMAQEDGARLLAGALYRGGGIARAQRQALPGDTPIHLRDDQTRYPIITAGEVAEDFATSQLGCSAPVNNAPPSAVLTCASLLTQVALDTLTERYEFTDEVIEVYRATDTRPFDNIGRFIQ